jgi:hypothetical protein
MANRYNHDRPIRRGKNEPSRHWKACSRTSPRKSIDDISWARNKKQLWKRFTNKKPIEREMHRVVRTLFGPHRNKRWHIGFFTSLTPIFHTKMIRNRCRRRRKFSFPPLWLQPSPRSVSTVYHAPMKCPVFNLGIHHSLEIRPWSYPHRIWMSNMFILSRWSNAITCSTLNR